MTLFKSLQSLCGLSSREAADILFVSESAIDKWRRGVKIAPPGALRTLQQLWVLIDQTAIDRAEDMLELGTFDSTAEIEIGYPVDDYEAQQIGLPCVGSWNQMLARLIDELMLAREDFDTRRISLVPRGSTPATAGAIDAREG